MLATESMCNVELPKNAFTLKQKPKHTDTQTHTHARTHIFRRMHHWLRMELGLAAICSPVEVHLTRCGSAQSNTHIHARAHTYSDTHTPLVACGVGTGDHLPFAAPWKHTK